MVAVCVFDPLGSQEQLDMSLVDSLHSPWYRCDVACVYVCGKPLLAVMFHPIFISYPFFSLTTTPPLLCVITHSPRSNYCVCVLHRPKGPQSTCSWIVQLITYNMYALGGGFDYKLAELKNETAPLHRNSVNNKMLLAKVFQQVSHFLL